MAKKIESLQDLLRARRERRAAQVERAAAAQEPAPVDATWTPGDAATGSHVLVRLTGFSATALDSEDVGRTREGTLVMDVAGSPTSLSWAARKTGTGSRSAVHLLTPDKFGDVVLYAGEAEPFINSRIQVVETDIEQVKEFGRKLSAFLGVVGAAGQFTPHGAIISAAVGLIGAGADAAAGHADDDVELLFLGGLRDEPGNAGEARISRGHDLQLSFDIADMKPEPKVKVGRKNKYPRLQVYIADLRVKLKKPARKRDLLDISIGVGKQVFNEKVPIPKTGRIDRILGVENYRICSGDWTGMVPFSVSVSTIDREESNSLDEIAGRGKALGEAILEARGRPDDEIEDMEAQVDRSQAVINATRNFLMEFSTKKTAVGTMQGVFVNNGAVTGLSGESKAIQQLNFGPNGLAETEISLKTETGGSVTLTLLFQKTDPS